MLEAGQRVDLGLDFGGYIDEPFPTIHASCARLEEESKERQLDALTVLSLLFVNCALIVAVVKGGPARFEGFPGAGQAVLAVLWSLQAIITFLFFVVVARWLKGSASSLRSAGDRTA